MAVIGCIADDFTGAGDGASFLAKGGMQVLLYNGIPGECEALEGAGAIVIALKSRTQDTGQAVSDSLAAADFLLKAGVKQIYFKYCSTFDSTPKGNIGPVADALMDFLRAPYTLLCPALPVNGRTVVHGNLLVHGVPLHESPMKDHPLTPMWDSRIDRLMSPQSRYSCRWFSLKDVDILRKEMDRRAEGEPVYLVPDYTSDADGKVLAAHFGHLPLLTGGSGLLEHLARIHGQKAVQGFSGKPGFKAGLALIVAGSCSPVTLGQIRWYQNQGLPSQKLEPVELLEGKQTEDGLWELVQETLRHHASILLYSSDTPDRVKESQEAAGKKAAEILEKIISRLAVRAVEHGVVRIISAGGETSGAVTQALGFSSYLIGESVAPGVPVMIPWQRQDLRLVLKSGNFGREDFFGLALEATGGV